ncbi:MAG: glucose-6-phosphate isomerase [Thermosynechococcaceae cyanobacterium]
MDAAQLWQRYQDWLYYHDGLGIYLDVSRMRFTEADVDALRPKFDRAFAEMAALEGGAIANPDENRMVGHYWLRAPDLAPTPELKADVVNTLDAIEQFVQAIHSGKIHPPLAAKFTDILSIGIGGSSLGPQFVAEALAPFHPPLQIHFLDNADPVGMDRVLTTLQDRLSSTLVIVISKSGGTPETRIGMLEMQKQFRDRGLNFAQQAVAVTGEGSRLDEVAKSEGWIARFPMHDWVGGRTSELSAVGLLPAALQGVPIRDMLDGAKIMDEATRIPELRQNPAALLALSWYIAGEGKGLKDMVVLPYKDSLQLFSRYLQQLVMESLGKELDLAGNVVNQGLAVYGNKGSTDQHAYVQQLREGLPNFFATLIEVLQDRPGPSMEIETDVTTGDYLSGFLLGTREALYEKGRDTITVTLPTVNAKLVGALIALYERAVGLYASLIQVNAYHQPGVEAGKKAAAATLALQQALIQCLRQANGPVTLADLAEKAGASDRVETVYKIVRHLAANGRIRLEGSPHQPSQLSVARL